MSNSICIVGPIFSLTGETLFVDQVPGFSVSFDNTSDQELVLAYEWYLDSKLLIDQQLGYVSLQTSFGNHTIGLRILTAEGWSGIKMLNFKNYPLPTLKLVGPLTVLEGKTADYTVIAEFSDGTKTDLSSAYILTATEGSFNGLTYTSISNTSSNDNRQITLSAEKNGIAEITLAITVKDTTPVTIVSREITGPDNVNEGSTAIYKVMVTYSNGITKDLTYQYKLTGLEGVFDGGALSVPANNIIQDTRARTIVALKNGIQVASKQITIVDTSAIWYNTLQSHIFNKTNCEEGLAGGTYTYTVAAGTYSSGLSQQAADQLALDDVTANGQQAANDPVNNVPCLVLTPCSNQAAYNGGPAFPTEIIIQLGSSTGYVTLNYGASNIPDKFIVLFDGTQVINTGYRGAASSQASLDSALAAKGLPSEIIQGPGTGTTGFYKSTTVTTAIVQVFAPISGTAWSFNMSCPEESFDN